MTMKLIWTRHARYGRGGVGASMGYIRPARNWKPLSRRLATAPMMVPSTGRDTVYMTAQAPSRTRIIPVLRLPLPSQRHRPIRMAMAPRTRMIPPALTAAMTEGRSWKTLCMSRLFSLLVGGVPRLRLTGTVCGQAGLALWSGGWWRS